MGQKIVELGQESFCRITNQVNNVNRPPQNKEDLAINNLLWCVTWSWTMGERMYMAEMGGLFRSLTANVKVVIICASNPLKRDGVLLTIKRVRADAPPAVDRVTGIMLAAALHDSDLVKENVLEFNRNLHHHIARKPLWQLHLIEIFMMTTNKEIIRITSQDLEQVPAN
jgi:hypothetical protein